MDSNTLIAGILKRCEATRSQNLTRYRQLLEKAVRSELTEAEEGKLAALVDALGRDRKAIESDLQAIVRVSQIREALKDADKLTAQLQAIEKEERDLRAEWDKAAGEMQDRQAQILTRKQPVKAAVENVGRLQAELAERLSADLFVGLEA